MVRVASRRVVRGARRGVPGPARTWLPGACLALAALVEILTTYTEYTDCCSYFKIRVQDYRSFTVLTLVCLPSRRRHAEAAPAASPRRRRLRRHCRRRHRSSSSSSSRHPNHHHYPHAAPPHEHVLPTMLLAACRGSDAVSVCKHFHLLESHKQDKNRERKCIDFGKNFVAVERGDKAVFCSFTKVNVSYILCDM